jgi:hypothetical protein
MQQAEVNAVEIAKERALLAVKQEAARSMEVRAKLSLIPPMQASSAGVMPVMSAQQHSPAAHVSPIHPSLPTMGNASAQDVFALLEGMERNQQAITRLEEQEIPLRYSMAVLESLRMWKKEETIAATHLREVEAAGVQAVQQAEGTLQAAQHQLQRLEIEGQGLQGLLKSKGEANEAARQQRVETQRQLLEQWSEVDLARNGIKTQRQQLQQSMMQHEGMLREVKSNLEMVELQLEQQRSKVAACHEPADRWRLLRGEMIQLERQLKTHQNVVESCGKDREKLQAQEGASQDELTARAAQWTRDLAQLNQEIETVTQRTQTISQQEEEEEQRMGKITQTYSQEKESIQTYLQQLEGERSGLAQKMRQLAREQEEQQQTFALNQASIQALTTRMGEAQIQIEGLEKDQAWLERELQEVTHASAVKEEAEAVLGQLEEQQTAATLQIVTLEERLRSLTAQEAELASSTADTSGTERLQQLLDQQHQQSLTMGATETREYESLELHAQEVEESIATARKAVASASDRLKEVMESQVASRQVAQRRLLSIRQVVEGIRFLMHCETKPSFTTAMTADQRQLLELSTEVEPNILAETADNLRRNYRQVVCSAQQSSNSVRTLQAELEQCRSSGHYPSSHTQTAASASFLGTDQLLPPPITPHYSQSPSLSPWNLQHGTQHELSQVSLQRNLAAKDDIIRVLERQIAELDGNNNQLSDRHHRQVEESETQLRNSHSEVQRMQSEVDQSYSYLQQRSDELVALEETLAQTRTDLWKEQQQRRAAEERNSLQQQKLEQYTREMEEMEAEIRQLRE